VKLISATTVLGTDITITVKDGKVFQTRLCFYPLSKMLLLSREICKGAALGDILGQLIYFSK
jgi:hypothetical protein